MKLFDLNSKSFLITGASSGIGRATAILFSDLGANIIGIGRDKDNLQYTLNQMKNPQNHLMISLDITDFSGLEVLLSKTISEFGKINGFAHCAGISTTLPLKMIKPEKYDLFFHTNVLSALNISRIITKKGNIADNGASIVFISSVMSVVGEVGKSLYGLTKGALDAAVKSLAIELASKHVRVNSILPGVVETEMSKKAFFSQSPSDLERISKLHPLGIGQPMDLAAACAFLMSDAARWITGTNMIVDGGYTAR